MIISLPNTEPQILVIDPGNDKTGVALLTGDGQLVARAIIATEAFDQEVGDLLANYGSLERVLCGNGTNHKRLYGQLQKLAKGYNLPAQLAEEYHTTEEAKKLYWVYNPPKGWRKLMPKGMLYPPEPVDDLTAYVIGKRWLANQ